VLVKLVVSLKLTHCKTGETGSFFADQHYEAALQNMDAVLELNDTRSIIYLLLMALYCLRGPKDPAAWTLAGLAVRNCIELGLHRKSPAGKITMERELDVRLFWSCYYLDREMSVALGGSTNQIVQSMLSETS
jgi:hypothetical protein